MPESSSQGRAPDRAAAVARLSAESVTAGIALVAAALVFLLCPGVLP